MAGNPTDIRALDSAALAMAFGMAVQSKPGTVPTGALAVIADELARRSLLTGLLAALGPDRGGAIQLAIVVDRSRVRTAARTGR